MLYVDVYEPGDMVKLLNQVSGITTQVVPLNHGQHRADYVWHDPNGNIFQIERKHWAEIIGKIDEVEDQLDRTRSQAHRTYLLIEDLLIPSQNGALGYSVEWSARPQRGQPRHWFKTSRRYGEPSGKVPKIRPQPQLYRRVVSWLDSLDKAGVTTLWAPTMGASAVWISQLYKNSFREEFYAFQRYLKPQIKRREKDDQVKMLMRMFYGVGQVTAQQLVEAYETVWNVLRADVTDLAEVIGLSLAKDICLQMGRNPDGIYGRT